MGGVLLVGSFQEVSIERLRKNFAPDQLDFETTAEVSALTGMVGQERAMKAMEFGLNIKSYGYNIFMVGVEGTGKLSYAQSIVKEKAKNEKTPDDLCYVYNFDNPDQPLAMSLPPGEGTKLMKDMDELVNDLGVEINKAFDSKQYDTQKNEIIEVFEKRKSELFEKLNRFAIQKGFSLKFTSTGFMIIPIIDGKAVGKDEYEQLDEEIRRQIEEKSAEVNRAILEMMQEITDLEKKLRDDVKELEKKVGDFAVGNLLKAIKGKYAENEKITRYLEAVEKDVLEHLDDFRTVQEDNPLLLLSRGSRENYRTKYKVNLLVDNKNTQGAPVVFEPNPTYYNLIGSVEYRNNFGTAVTDFTMIKAGALHKANGGYLILQAKDVLMNFQAWDALKRVIKMGEVKIENIGNQLSVIAFATLKPEAIPIKVKIILVGNPMLYQLLQHFDEDFSELFKVKADFNDEMYASKENIDQLVKFIASHCEREGLRHFDREGTAEVIEYSSRLAGDQRKLTTRFNELVEVLHEANAWAELDGAKVISREHVKRAIAEKIYRSNKYEEYMLEHFKDGKILIDTEGEVVGQVNGLAVLDFGDYMYGKPSRITATTYLGKRGIVSIEREVEMSGTIHSKGLYTLSGYLGEKYAKETPLAVSATIAFEQLYGGVDGDSASSTELYVLLSSLADVPIKQGIAVTGSVNQKGQIQPVGGVTQKIEGFFKVCKERGLTGEQGVIIPHQNVDNLVLNDEVVEAIEKGMFHIYPVKTVDEGIEILTGVPAGVKDEEGRYPEGTIHDLVLKKLKSYYEKVRGKEQDTGEKGN
jgi:lon-related putative ATP-dependent protease